MKYGTTMDVGCCFFQNFTKIHPNILNEPADLQNDFTVGLDGSHKLQR